MKNDDLSRIFQRIDTVEYISTVTGEQYKNRRRRYACPLCGGRKSFSFYCHVGLYRFKCFSCGKQGNAYDFEIAMGLSKKETLGKLARYAGFYLDSESLPKPESKQKQEQKPVLAKPKQKPESDWPTKDDIFRAIDESDQGDIESDIERWVELRNFGPYGQEACRAIRKACIGIYTRAKGKSRENYLIFPVRNNGQVVTVQMIGYPKADSAGKINTPKLFSRNPTEEAQKGFLEVFPEAPSTNDIFIVESISNAVCLACVGLSEIGRAHV